MSRPTVAEDRAVRIPLRGTTAYALVSPEDAERVAGLRWRLTRGYAVTGRSTSMSRLLMGCTAGDGVYVDHINRVRLDNRRANLRIVTPAQSSQNKRATGGASRYRGVSVDKHSGLWIAQAQLDGKDHFLGKYDSEEQAAAVASQWRAEHMPFSADALGQPPIADGIQGPIPARSALAEPWRSRRLRDIPLRPMGNGFHGPHGTPVLPRRSDVAWLARVVARGEHHPGPGLQRVVIPTAYFAVDALGRTWNRDDGGFWSVAS